jgi:hypothetical protein
MAAIAPSSGYHASVTTEKSDWFLVFPIVGSAPGGGGLFFRSETTIVNNLQRPQNVVAFFFPAGGGGCGGGATRPLKLETFSWYVWTDIVRELFGSSGLGSVLVIAADSGGNPDPSARLDGFSRIWTPVAGGGTASQSFAPSSPTTSGTEQSAYGLRSDSGFRTNVGIFNYLPTGTSANRLFDVYTYGFNGGESKATLSVPPCSVVLQGVSAPGFGNTILTIVPRDSAGGWYGFGSSVDNFSGDNWSCASRP